MDAMFFFFRDKKAAFPGRAHGRDKEIVANHVEFLLVIACCVGATGQAGEVYERCTSDIVCYGFEGELEGVAEESKVIGRLVWAGLE